MSVAPSREQFALWSFEHDRLDDPFLPRGWSCLDAGYQRMYLEEADWYLARPMACWPTDILERLAPPEKK